MQKAQCPACGRETAPDTACPGCGHAANGAVGNTPAPPAEVAGWVIERPSPDVLAWAAQTFDMAQHQAALREIEQGGGANIHDLIAEIERKLDGTA
jgi:hypothetical protein